MSSKILDRLARVEGIINVVTDPGQVENKVVLESGRSTQLERRLEGKYPLEAIQLTQLLSSKSGVAHAIAAVSAIENYLQLDPTSAALGVRLILLRLSSIYAHIHHFYLELLPDYLGKTHFSGALQSNLRFFIGFRPNAEENGLLPDSIGRPIVSNTRQAVECLNQLQKTMALLGGKYPVIMNIVPGGVSNFRIKAPLVMEVTRRLETIKSFVEVTWPQDVKAFIGALPETGLVLEKQVNLISFGSQPSGIIKDHTTIYSEGAWINGKLEPVNELKITESYQNTHFKPLSKRNDQGKLPADFQDTKAKTWIKGARYDSEPMLAGALSRMLVTHFGGGNMEISDRLGQMIDDLGISIEAPNCVASRLLSEVFESRFYFKTVMSTLLDFDFDQPLNRKTEYSFSEMGAGIGKVEAPNGALLHQIYVEHEKIAKYRIVSATNWNFSSSDSDGKTGIVEQELNVLNEKGALSSLQASRLLHSYNAQILDGTR